VTRPEKKICFDCASDEAEPVEKIVKLPHSRTAARLTMDADCAHVELQ
jgi:hypothetical protein